MHLLLLMAQSSRSWLTRLHSASNVCGDADGVRSSWSILYASGFSDATLVRLSEVPPSELALRPVPNVTEAQQLKIQNQHRVEAATAAAKEVLLRLGRDDTGLISELGPVIASFDFPVRFNFQNAKSKLGSGKTKFDDRLGCLRVEDTRHDLELLIWPSGRCVALRGRLPGGRAGRPCGASPRCPWLD